MGIFGAVGAVVKGAVGYTAARGKERTTALGGGLCIAALYFRVTNPKAMDETMFYIVFGLGAVVALLKTEFMRAVAIALRDAVRGRFKTSRSSHDKGEGVSSKEVKKGVKKKARRRS